MNSITFSAITLFFVLLVGISSSAGSFSFAQQEPSTTTVPEWIKQTLKWYYEGTVSEREFLNAIKFLVESKIIQINGNEEDLAKDPTLQTSQITVTKPRIKQCEILFQSYKNVGEQRFKNTYLHVTYLKECITLYKDPIWKYHGEDRHDKLYDRLTELLQAKPEQKKLSDEPSVKILSKTNIGKEKYDVKFNVCAGDKKIDKAKVLIKSQIESVEYGTNKDIPENACRTYVTQINAKNPDNIFITILESVLE